LLKAYTDKAGVEFEHISNFEEKSWLYNRYEELICYELSQEEKLYILRLMTESEVQAQLYIKQNRRLITSYIKNSKLLKDTLARELSPF
jgi:2-oxoglutarate dehydrogenase complex dehydrogenase (E1) component-like enzyme